MKTSLLLSLLVSTSLLAAMASAHTWAVVDTDGTCAEHTPDPGGISINPSAHGVGAVVNVDFLGDQWCVLVMVGTAPLDPCPEVFVNNLIVSPGETCLP